MSKYWNNTPTAIGIERRKSIIYTTDFISLGEQYDKKTKTYMYEFKFLNFETGKADLLPKHFDYLIRYVKPLVDDDIIFNITRTYYFVDDDWNRRHVTSLWRDETHTYEQSGFMKVWVEVIGYASNRWRNPRAHRTRDFENIWLSYNRALMVKWEIEKFCNPIKITNCEGKGSDPLSFKGSNYGHERMVIVRVYLKEPNLIAVDNTVISIGNESHFKLTTLGGISASLGIALGGGVKLLSFLIEDDYENAENFVFEAISFDASVGADITITTPSLDKQDFTFSKCISLQDLHLCFAVIVQGPDAAIGCLSASMVLDYINSKLSDNKVVNDMLEDPLAVMSQYLVLHKDGEGAVIKLNTLDHAIGGQAQAVGVCIGVLVVSE